MKKAKVENTVKPAKSVRPSPPAGNPPRIHPVVIYPFRQPGDFSDLEELYGMVAQLNGEPATFARPVTVMDRKTYRANAEDKRFLEFRSKTVAQHSDILDAWCVDTCQMWYTGLGAAFEQGGPEDVYWLIPGDFDYGTQVGRDVLGRLHDLPEICQELQQDICIGEVAIDPVNSKQIIDTYGTFALLYIWFPAAARQLRQMTERPRSEFFAVRHGFLGELLAQRWFAYEQTVVMLLQAVLTGKSISRFSVGNISDLPEGRESPASAMQQVERTERVLKTLWRERNESTPGWTDQYRILEDQSRQARETALTLLANLLR